MVLPGRFPRPRGPMKFHRSLFQRNPSREPSVQPRHCLRVTRFARALISPPSTELVGRNRQWPSENVFNFREREPDGLLPRALQFPS